MKELPESIKEVGFDFSWDERKVWQLDVPVELMPIAELTWHFDYPFLWSKPSGYYDLTPREIIENPEKYPEEYTRTINADASYPIDIMKWRGRWLILDGLHRLMQHSINGVDVVQVRKIPMEAIPRILKD